MKYIKFFYTLLITTTVLVISFQSQAQPYVTEEPIMELLSGMADKPEDHKAIANYYRNLASEAMAEASLHEKMKEKYRHNHDLMKGRSFGKTTQRHCNRIIKLQESVVKEYNALAELHEKLAKQ